MARHLFPGGNTPIGFFSYYGNIMSPGESGWTVYLKGSSGSGKSGFIRKVGKYFQERGDEVEYMHCSNDPQSLDGVFMPAKRILLLDGTAPHEGEPRLPGVSGEILNLGKFIDYGKAEKQGRSISRLADEKKAVIAKAYGFFAAAHSIYLNNSRINSRLLNRPAVDSEILKAVKMLDKATATGTGRNRRMFLSAVTPNGFCSYVGNELVDREIWVLHGGDGAGTDIMLTELQRAANLRGFDTESFCCALRPEKIEHLLIPELNMFLTTSNDYHTIHCVGERPAREIFFDEFLTLGCLRDYEGEKKYNYAMFDKLMKKTVEYLKQSSELHEQIEGIYKGCMDFKSLDVLCVETIERLGRIQ